MFPSGNIMQNYLNPQLPPGNTQWYFINKFISLQTYLMLALFLTSNMVWSAENIKPIRFGLTPAIIHNEYELLTDLREYLQKKLGRPLEFISRDSYRETIDLIKQQKIDFAWVSDYPYIYLEVKHLARLLVTPLYHGRPYYCSYLIVPNSDLETTSLLHLKGKLFAYADPYSNSGYLVPRYQLHQAGEDPNRFFSRTLFTWGHRKVAEAVAQGLVDAGSLDSFVWDTLAVMQPNLSKQTRIVAKSPEYGFPPIVVSHYVKEADSVAMQQVLLNMVKDPEGSKLLARLNLTGFIPGNAKLYDKVRIMMRTMNEL